MSRFTQRDTYDGTAGNPITQNHYLYGAANPMMFVDPSGHLILDTAATAIRGTLGGIRTAKLPISSQGTINTLAKGINFDGKGYVLESVVNFVIDALTDFDSGTDNRTSSGRRAHSKLQREIGAFKPLGKYIKLVPEVSLCPLGIPKPNNFKPKEGWYTGYILRIDIQVYFKDKLLFIADLKTGGASMGLTKCKEYSRRHGGVPVVEITIPWL